MTLPRFLCIGAQKAGTSWLNEQLQRHPEIWMPPIKELHFFDHLYGRDTPRWSRWHLRTGALNAIRWHMESAGPSSLRFIRYVTGIHLNDPFTEEWYRYVFSWHKAAGKVTGDITPEYSTISLDGIRYLKALLPGVKLIYIIRDPLSRALSQLRMNYERGKLRDDSEAAWLDAARDPVLVHRGAYSQYVPRWLGEFRADDLMFIPYRRLREAPEAVLADIERHIGVSPHRYPHARTSVHETAKVPIPDSAVAVLRDLVEVDTRFIATAFGAEFAAMT